jgi:hypothetical protein
MIRKEDRLTTLAAGLFITAMFIALNMNEVLNHINSLN